MVALSQPLITTSRRRVGSVEANIHAFYTSALEVNDQLDAPGAYPRRKIRWCTFHGEFSPGRSGCGHSPCRESNPGRLPAVRFTGSGIQGRSVYKRSAFLGGAFCLWRKNA
jgi:hypothetical protein